MSMFHQISIEGSYAHVHLNEEVRRYGENSIEDLLVKLSQLDNVTALIPPMINELSNKGNILLRTCWLLLKKRVVERFMVELW